MSTMEETEEECSVYWMTICCHCGTDGAFLVHCNLELVDHGFNHSNGLSAIIWQKNMPSIELVGSVKKWATGVALPCTLERNSRSDREHSPQLLFRFLLSFLSHEVDFSTVVFAAETFDCSGAVVPCGGSTWTTAQESSTLSRFDDEDMIAFC